MSIPTVETFESDITDEIKQKQGSVTDVLAAHSKAPIDPPDYPLIKMLIVIIVLLTLGIIAVIFFLFFRQPPQTVPLQEVVTAPKTEQASLLSILPRTGPRIEPYITSVTKNANGYILKLSNYTFVYGNILNNEDQFGKELLTLFSIVDVTDPVFKDVLFSNQDLRLATVSKKVELPLATQPVATSTGTSTTLMASTTQVSSSTLPVTASSSTQTVATSTGTSTEAMPEVFYISYGFVGTSTLLISTTKEKFLELRGAILK